MSKKPSVDAIFCAAIEIESADQRQSYLHRACGEDAELRQQVKRLLQAHYRGGSIMDAPAHALCHTLDQPPLEQPGMQIGPYRLLQEIGEGGMGVVYMAEQKEPVERRVALKIIKPGMDTRQVIARFEAERQALAMMDHPNIAKVLDAGTTDSGRPYFVMELVNGIPVTQFCDEQHLTARERLELFIPICQAVQHAHQKGVIHRDIKPSNILMALYDGRPVPKIIDFGVAKATGGRLTEKTMFTGLGQIVGTIEYMSPEQANRNQLDIDTRSDVYSLGVVLYELLTGDTPFDKQRLHAAAIDELLRIIREEEPPKPSTRLSSSETLASVAANRHIEPAKLSALVRGELDWIVMKALEKDRARRYESASKFAEDVQHYLNDDPVVACPPTAGYRFRKFARRNKVALAAGTAILLTLTCGVIGTTWQAARATRQRDRSIAAESLAEARLEAETRAREEAQNAERRATAESVRSGQIARFMKDMLQAVDPDVALGQDTTLLRGILDQTAERLDDELLGQPEVEAELRLVLGVVYRDLGQFDKAEAMDRRALQLNRRLFGGEHADVADSMYDLALTLTKQKKLDEAESMHRQALAVRRKLCGNDHALVAQSLDDLGYTLHLKSNNAEAEALYREALAVQKKLFGDEGVAVAESLSSLAGLLRVERRLSEAEKLHREALAIRKKVFGNEHPKVATSLNSLANVLRDQRKLLEAEGMHREALAMRRKIYGNEHPYVAQSLTHLAFGLRIQGKLNEALKLFEEALAVQKRVLPPEHPDIADTVDILAYTYRLLGRFDNAREQYETLLASYEKLHLDSPQFAMLLFQSGNVHRELGSCLTEQKKPDEAQRHMDQAIACYRQATALRPNHAGTYMNLGNVLFGAGKLDEAIACYRQAIELKPKYAAAHFLLGNALANQGNLDEAVACYHNAIEVDPRSYGAHHNLGHCLAIQGKLDEAVTCFRQAIEIAPRQPLAHNNLGNALERQGKLDEAIACYRQAIELDPKDAWKYNNLAWLLATTNDIKFRNYAEALALAQQAVQLDPQSWQIWDTLSVAAYRAGDWQTSLDARQEKLQRHPMDSEDQLFLAMTHWQLGRHDQACEDYVQAAAALDKNDQLDQVLLRDEAETLIDAEALIRFCTAGIEAKPESTMLFMARAYARARSGQLDQAAEDYAQALLLLPEPTDPWWGPNAASNAPMVESDEIYERLAVLRPQHRGLRIARVNRLGAQGKWDELSAQLAAAIELDPTDHGGWWRAAAVSLYGEDAQAFRRSCDELVARFAETSDPLIAKRVAESCLLSPDAAGQLNLARRLAERAVSDADNDEGGWFQLAKALADYRGGDLETAVASAKTSQHASPSDSYRDATSLLVQAMAEHQLGRVAEAHQSLRAARDIMEQQMPTAESGSLGDAWFHWLRFHILRREAEALIDHKVAKPQRGSPTEAQGGATSASRMLPSPGFDPTMGPKTSRSARQSFVGRGVRCPFKRRHAETEISRG